MYMTTSVNGLHLHTSSVQKLVVTGTHYLNVLEIMNKEKCKFCGSTEMVYHQYIICDSMCQECGEWQKGEYNYE